MTGMPARPSARTVSAISGEPPSSFTASQRVSCMTRPALSTARSTVT
jgi:hypothetical protein